MTKKLGIIQTRGLGDLIIALPIAHHYDLQGYQVHWPILEEWVDQMSAAAPWVKWIPVAPDHGPFFYDVPMQRLKNFGCDEIICLYQSLTGHNELSGRPEFQITKFDELKYRAAGVPFLDKWKLGECIARDHDREQALKERVVKSDAPYVVAHLTGSDHAATLDPAWIPEGWDLIEIKDQSTSIFDWISTLESAEAIICVDSVFANMVDQLGINNTVDSYFIPRSHIHLTPVLGNPWTTLDPGPDVLKRISIFRMS
jgi:hypothetical protein